MSIIRRLDRLETHYPAGPDGHDRAGAAWLMSLPDADIDFLATAAERIKAGRPVDDLDPPMRARWADLLAAWQTRYPTAGVAGARP